jgi:hypothetical protein
VSAWAAAGADATAPHARRINALARSSIMT